MKQSRRASGTGSVQRNRSWERQPVKITIYSARCRAGRWKDPRAALPGFLLYVTAARPAGDILGFFLTLFTAFLGPFSCLLAKSGNRMCPLFCPFISPSLHTEKEIKSRKKKKKRVCDIDMCLEGSYLEQRAGAGHDAQCYPRCWAPCRSLPASVGSRSVSRKGKPDFILGNLLKQWG